MNYKTLKWMVDSLIKTFTCPLCNSGINEENVEIIWAAWNTINIDIECAKCKKHSMIKAEFSSINIPINLSNWPKWLLEDLERYKNKNIDFLNSKIITDKEIVDLNKKLKKTDLNASDLFDG